MKVKCGRIKNLPFSDDCINHTEGFKMCEGVNFKASYYCDLVGKLDGVATMAADSLPANSSNLMIHTPLGRATKTEESVITFHLGPPPQM